MVDIVLAARVNMNIIYKKKKKKMQKRSMRTLYEKRFVTASLTKWRNSFIGTPDIVFLQAVCIRTDLRKA